MAMTNKLRCAHCDKQLVDARTCTQCERPICFFCVNGRQAGARCPVDPEPLALDERLEKELEEAERKAWASLSRYKFQMFGYWAAIWVHLNRVGGFGRSNPWRMLTDMAKVEMKRGPRRSKKEESNVETL